MSRQIALISEHASPLGILGGVDSGGQTRRQVLFDLVRSLQVVLEETVLHLAPWLYHKTHSEALVWPAELHSIAS